MSFQIGDLLLISYKYDPIAWLIQLITKSQWNHVTLIIDKKYILEMNRKGLLISSIDKYNNNNFFRTKIIRILDFNKYFMNMFLIIKSNFHRFNNSDFKLPILFVLLCILLKIKINRYSCSGYLAEVLNGCGFKFIENKDHYFITPADIDNSKYTENVCQCIKEDRVIVVDNNKKIQKEYCFKCKKRF